MKKYGYKILELLLCPLTIISALWLKFIRKNIIGFWSDSSLITKRILYTIGVFPILDHYYEPLFNPSRLRYSLQKERFLPGIDFNVQKQLSLLHAFNYNQELNQILGSSPSKNTFSFHQNSFLSGDAEYLFNTIRFFKPSKIVEIGCGFSTRLIQHAIEYNRRENASYTCRHICIEPFEHAWLDRLPLQIIRENVENVDINIFKQMQGNDIVFIDSSHIIRPQGDVLFEYLEILPILNPGVLIHIHDIFTPRDYLPEWIIKGKVFWNEQYLVEAFLCYNSRFQIIGALNYLKHHYFDELESKCPFLSQEREPGSFWIQRI